MVLVKYNKKAGAADKISLFYALRKRLFQLYYVT